MHRYIIFIIRNIFNVCLSYSGIQQIFYFIGYFSFFDEPGPKQSSFIKKKRLFPSLDIFSVLIAIWEKYTHTK